MCTPGEFVHHNKNKCIYIYIYIYTYICIWIYLDKCTYNKHVLLIHSYIIYHIGPSKAQNLQNTVTFQCQYPGGVNNSKNATNMCCKATLGFLYLLVISGPQKKRGKKNIHPNRSNPPILLLEALHWWNAGKLPLPGPYPAPGKLFPWYLSIEG